MSSFGAELTDPCVLAGAELSAVKKLISAGAFEVCGMDDGINDLMRVCVCGCVWVCS